MKSGYTKAYRKELESDIWQMPYLYHRVFYWLRQKAPWKSDVFPTQRKMNIYLNPGQIITSMGNIAEGVAYMENNVLKVPQRKTIQRILEWLNYHGMIALARHRQGTTIFILNWDTYQSKDEVACHSNDTTSDTDADTTSDTHLKKLKKYKKYKKLKKTTGDSEDEFSLPEWINLEAWDGYLEMRKENKKPLKTLRAMNLAVKTLEKLKDEGHDPNAVLDKSTEFSWQGLFPLNGNNNNGNGLDPKNRFAGLDKAGEIIKQRIKEEEDAKNRLGQV